MWPFKRNNRPATSTAEDREIFRFHDGIQERTADPMVLWNRLWDDPAVKPEVDYKAWEERNELEAVDRIVPHARRIFDLKPYEDGGLTGNEALRLLKRFLAYTQDIAKKNDPLPIPFRIWASKFSGQSTTKPAAESSSTSNELPSDEPTGPTEPSSQPLAAA
jgi:hypothetical protein